MLSSCPASALIILLLSHPQNGKFSRLGNLQHLCQRRKKQDGTLCVCVWTFPSDTERFYAITPRQVSRYKLHLFPLNLLTRLQRFEAGVALTSPPFWLPESLNKPPSTAHTKSWVCLCSVVLWGSCHAVYQSCQGMHCFGLVLHCTAGSGEATVPWVDHLLPMSAVAGHLF